MEPKVENANAASEPVVELKNDQAPPEEPKATEKPSTPEPAPNPILEKVLKEKKNAMERVRELEAQMQTITDERLKEKEDWKTLYETTKTKLDTLNSELEQERVEKVNGHKLSSLKKELAKMGAQDSAMDALLKLADLGKLKYDSEHKVVLGTEETARAIKDAIPAAFGKATAGVDQDAPSTKFVNVDLNTFKQMNAQDKKNPEILRQIYEKHGITVRD